MTHLHFDIITADEEGAKEHPQKVMKELGITYQDSTPQSIGDCWFFWNCENIPEKLPKYLRVLDTDPMDWVGYGLSKGQAKRIAYQMQRLKK